MRALTEVAGLRLEDVRRVLGAVDDPDVSLHEAIGSAHSRLPSRAAVDRSPTGDDVVDALLERHGWELDETSPHRTHLAAALASVAALGLPTTSAHLDAYAEAASIAARSDLAALDTETETDPVSLTERAVIGTLLLEPVLLTLRRVAQENLSREAWG